MSAYVPAPQASGISPKRLLAGTADHKAVPGRPFLSILRYNRPYWKAYAVGTFLGLLFLLVSIATPLIVRAIIQAFEEGTMTSRLLWIYFALLISISLFTNIARYWQRTLMIRASRKFEYDLRNDFFRHVEGLSQEFFNRNSTGDIMARATNDLNFIRMFVGPGIMGTVDMLRIPYTIALMLYLSVKLTFVALAIIPFAAIVTYLIIRFVHRQSLIVQELFASISTRAQENLAGARVVKAYGAAEREEKAFRRESTRYMRESLKLTLVMNFMWPIISLLLGTTTILIIWQGGLMVIHDSLTSRIHWADGGLALQSVPFTLGDLTGFIMCLFMLSFPLINFGWIATFYQRGAVGMKRMTEILGEVPAIRDQDLPAGEPQPIRGGIRFEDVSFGYGEDPVLRDLSFEVAPGQTLAIVGPTGSGKSTIISLIARQYDPTLGHVLFDGVDARHIPLGTLREAVGCVPQDAFLFSDTIRANLTVGNPGASAEVIQEACEIAQFDKALEGLEHGYETELGERGINLSGGQKQRLTIARAIIQDPKILLLDDTLSSVDTATEEHILRGLKKVTAQRTSIIISHRVSTVQHADLILVLDEGHIVERGTHQELLAHHGLYADMYERQLLEEELEEE